MDCTINKLKDFLLKASSFDEDKYIFVRRFIQPMRSKKSNYEFGLTKEKPKLEELNIVEFIESWSIFSFKQIPFELWADICEEGLELLKKLLEDPSIPYTELEGFKEFYERRRKRSEEIQKMPEYADRFTMDAYN